jgi:O-antigen/teichoic acid export membrane protein
MIAKLRSLASDTVVYGISTILGRFLTFLLTPLYTNYVTKAELGETAYLYSLIAFVNVVYSCGFDSAFFKFFKSSEKGVDVGTHNRSVFAHALMGIAVVSTTVTLFICAFPSRIASGLGLESVGTMVVYAGLIAFFDALVLVPFAALRMESRSKRFAVLKFAVIVLNVVANLVLVVKLHLGIRGIFLAGLLSSFVGVLLLLPEFRRYILMGKIVFDSSLFREMWRFGLPTVPAAFSAMMLQVADRPILKLFVDNAAIGVYQANYRLGIPMMLAVTVFEYAWKPFYLRETSRSRSSSASPSAVRKQRRAIHAMLARVLTYFTVVCGVVFLSGSLLIEYVVRMPFLGGRFVNPAYWSGLSIIPIILGAYYFNGLYVNFAASVYIRKRTGYLPAITGTAALANVALNFLLIPYYGIWGAAWATLGAYMLSAVLMYRLTRRIYPLRYEWRRVLLSVSICLIIFVLAVFTTSGMGLWGGLLARCAWILVYPFLLFAFGFFKSEEAAFLRTVSITAPQ